MGPHAMSGNPTGKVGLADAPAVELALSRSKVYLLLSWGFLFPEEEEFYNYLQDGEFVEDGFSAVESLEKSFDAVKAAPAARDLIFPIRKLSNRSASGNRKTSRRGNSATCRTSIGGSSPT